jgi:hypothetical protein
MSLALGTPEVSVAREATMMRYRVARAVGPDRYREVLKEDAELLQLYGLKLMCVESGLTAAIEEETQGGRINPWNVVEMNEKTWKWLRPLLLRLRAAEETVRMAHEEELALSLAAAAK